MNNNGTGSIQTRVQKDGKKVYDVRYRYFDVTKGKAASTTKRGFKRKADAQQFLDEVTNQIQTKKYVVKTQKTVKDVANEWFETEILPQLKPTTVNWYKVNKDNHIIPYIGDIKVQELDEEMLLELYDLKRSMGLAEKTVYYIHRTMKQILKYAVNHKYIAENITNSTVFKFNKDRKKVISIIEMDEICRIVQDKKMDREIIIAIALAGMMGMRRGEVLGLKWSQIIWDKKILNVAAQRTNFTEDTESLKTSESKRELPIPDIVYGLLQEQKNRIASQAQKYGKQYDFQNGFVCCHLGKGNFGKPLCPSNFSNQFARSLKKCGYKPVRFHDLRHSYATYLLHEKIPVTTVSVLLGHASPDITLKTYAHIAKTAYMAECITINENLSEIANKMSE